MIPGITGRHSIRRKLFTLIVVNGSFTLLVVGLLLFGYEKIETHVAAKRELASVAGIVADSSSASLTFLDDRAATDTLNALRSNEDILQAAIYDSSGHLFASYLARIAGRQTPARLTGAERRPLRK